MRDDEKWSICTSHIERLSLTVRTLMKRFTRPALGFSEKLDNFVSAVSMFMACYYFKWRTRHTNQSGHSGKHRPTVAMQAKVTDHLWRFPELNERVTN